MAMNLRIAQKNADAERINCFEPDMDPEKFERSMELFAAKNDLEEKFDHAISSNLAMCIGLQTPEEVVDTIMAAINFWLDQHPKKDLYIIWSMLRVRCTRMKERLEEEYQHA